MLHETELCFRNGRENIVLNVSENNGIARGTLPVQTKISGTQNAAEDGGDRKEDLEQCVLTFFSRNLYMERIFLSNVEILIWNIWI